MPSTVQADPERDPSLTAAAANDADVTARLVLAVITLCGGALRVYHLGFKSLWLDEAVLFWNANGDLSHIITNNAHHNSAPPLFAILLRGAIAFGSSEAALRAVSCLAGILAIPAMYWLGRSWLSRPGALLASALVAMAPQMIRYSQQVREYSLSFLIAVLLIGTLVRFLRTLAAADTVRLSALFVLAIFTQYGLALMILALNVVFVAWIARDRSRAGRAIACWTVVNAVGLVAVAAVYVLSLRQQFVAGGFGASSAADYLAAGYWSGTLRSFARLALRNTRDIIEFALPSALTVLACGFGVLAAIRTAGTRLALALLAVPFAVTFAAAMARAFPYIGERQTIHLAPMIYVFVAMGVTHLWQLTRDVAVAAVFAGLLAAYSINYTAGYLGSGAPENLRPIVDMLNTASKPSDGIYVHHGARAAFSYYMRNAGREWTAGIYSPDDQAAYARQIDELLRQPRDWWFVFAHSDPAEVELIAARASAHRTVNLVRQDEGAWLFHAQ